MGHKYGIGYRCGGVTNANGETHIDVRHRQWYGDESVSFKTAVCKSWYNYFTVVYKTLTTMNVRKSAGTDAKVVKKYTKGTEFIATSITRKGNVLWAKCADGYVCINDGHKYCEISSIKKK